LFASAVGLSDPLLAQAQGKHLRKSILHNHRWRATAKVQEESGLHDLIPTLNFWLTGSGTAPGRTKALA
jgi:hypothetical protein